MAKESDLIRHAKAEISRLATHIKKLDEARFKASAELKAYENLLEWSQKKNGDKDKKVSSKLQKQ